MRILNFTAALLLLAATAADAETLRCGSALVYEGSSVDDVLKKCGEPASRRMFTEDVYARTPAGGSVVTGTVTTELWRYDRGSRQFPAVLRIRDARVISIEFEK